MKQQDTFDCNTTVDELDMTTKANQEKTRLRQRLAGAEYPAESGIVQFAIRGLETCWMEDRNRFSHAFIYHPNPQNVSVPVSDVYYTLNVILGLANLRDKGKSLPYQVDSLFTSCCEELETLPVPKYAYGMAMWAAAEHEYAVPSSTSKSIERLLDSQLLWSDLTAQDAGLLLSGICRLHEQGYKRFSHYASPLACFIRDRFGATPSGLFFNNPVGFRGRFATFATAVYLILALFHYGRAFDSLWAVERAILGARALERCQGPFGEWPWFYDARKGIVLDCYPVFSVHQDGMAPAYLHLAEEAGVVSAQQQIERGLGWILGRNELQISMIDSNTSLIMRSHYRSKLPFERHTRALRAVVNSSLGRGSTYVGENSVSILQECRSYHLGWIIHSFAGRKCCPDLTNHEAFTLPLSWESCLSNLA